MARTKLIGLAVAVAFVAISGCAEVARVTGSTWHQKCGWKAEDYFDDAKVIELCHAIEANDIAEIDRLVAAGADVNAQGKGKMTPLLWAHPDNKLERFKRLLEHGANPNVVVESDFNTHGGMLVGDSVTHMACKTNFPGYFEAVFANGGDPNLMGKSKLTNGTPLFSVIEGRAPDKKAKVKTLIAKGADVDILDHSGLSATMTAVGWGGQYDTALVLLEAGADYKVNVPGNNSRLIHEVISEEKRRGAHWPPQQKAAHQKLVKWLEDHGESTEEAKADMKRWASWSGTADEIAKLRRHEIAVRKAKEAREKAAAKKADGEVK